MGRIVIDSSVFVSAFVETESQHLATLIFFNRLKKLKPMIIVPTLVVAEVINTLQKLGAERVDTALRYFSSFTIVDIDKKFLEYSLPLWKRLRLKTGDALVAITGGLMRAELISWDRELVSEAGNITKAVTPADVMRSSNF